MAPLGVFHLTTAVLAMGLGAAVLRVEPKGSRRHRQLGWAYVTSMLALNVSALMIYGLFGGFGPFHVLAIISLLTVVAGTGLAVAARRARLRRDPAARIKLLEGHYRAITWSYVGLIAAFVSEVVTRLPAAQASGAPGAPGAVFGIAVAIGTFTVVGVGARMIRARAVETLQPFRPRSAD